ncbi:MAG: LysR substrate-binding domain-containing protein [Cystobacter sp.]
MTTFVSVVETGGISSAARKLEVSPSVVSRMVTELEEHLGVRLLTRTTRLVRLTDAGSAYFENCRRILGELDEAEQSVTGAHSAPRGPLHVTAPVLFGKAYVMPIVLDYLARYPEVDLNCWFLDRVVNMIDEGIDVGIRIGELPSSSLQAVRVGQVRRVLCAAPAYLERQGVPRTPGDLTHHTTLSVNNISQAPEWRFSAEDDPVVMRPRPRLTTTTVDSAIAAAVAGFGITRLLSYQVASPLREGALRLILEDFEPPALPIHVIHREGRHASRKVRAFLDLAIETLRSDDSLN